MDEKGLEGKVIYPACFQKQKEELSDRALKYIHKHEGLFVLGLMILQVLYVGSLWYFNRYSPVEKAPTAIEINKKY